MKKQPKKTHFSASMEFIFNNMTEGDANDEYTELKELIQSHFEQRGLWRAEEDGYPSVDISSDWKVR